MEGGNALYDNVFKWTVHKRVCFLFSDWPAYLLSFQKIYRHQHGIKPEITVVGLVDKHKIIAGEQINKTNKKTNENYKKMDLITTYNPTNDDGKIR